jgi:hypothetical protein
MRSPDNHSSLGLLTQQNQAFYIGSDYRDSVYNAINDENANSTTNSQKWVIIGDDTGHTTLFYSYAGYYKIECECIPAKPPSDAQESLQSLSRMLRKGKKPLTIQIR